MAKKNLSPIGSLQSFVFCIGMYFVALFFSIFVCSSIFYAINPKKENTRDEITAGVKPMVNVKKVYAAVN